MPRYPLPLWKSRKRQKRDASGFSRNVGALVFHCPVREFKAPQMAVSIISAGGKLIFSPYPFWSILSKRSRQDSICRKNACTFSLFFMSVFSYREKPFPCVPPRRETQRKKGLTSLELFFHVLKPKRGKLFRRTALGRFGQVYFKLALLHWTTPTSQGTSHSAQRMRTTKNTTAAKSASIPNTCLFTWSPFPRLPVLCVCRSHA